MCNMKYYVSYFVLIHLVLCLHVTYAGFFSFLDFNNWFSNEDLKIYADNCRNEECTGGLRCNENCTGIELCVNNQICDVLTCNSSKYCTMGPKPTCNGDANTCPKRFEFECVELGLFPDVTNCSRYYNCTELSTKPEPTPCISNTKYDPNVGLCTLNDCNTDDAGIIKDCGKDVTCEQLKSSKYIYYICASNTLQFRHCESGSYNSQSCICNPLPQSTTTRATDITTQDDGSSEQAITTTETTTTSSGTTTTTAPTPETTTTTTHTVTDTTTVSPNDPYTCNDPYELVAIKGTCKSFCYCTPLPNLPSFLTCEVYYCPYGTHFDLQKMNCIDGEQCT